MTQAVKQMYQLLLTEPHAPTVCAQLERIAREALAEHAMQEVQRLGQEIEQEPVAHPVIAGALFDFMGWLTSRKERIVLSSADNASPAADAIRDFANMRGLSLDDAKVQDWNTSPPQPEQEPVAYYLPHKGFYWAKPTSISAPTIADVEPLPLYTPPPQRTWVDVPDEEIKILWIQYRAALPRYLCFAKALLARSKEENT